ncbi:gfo/Idh/MocA family oxidoreductase [Nocardioides sp. zg-579]|uniref:Gfo/Idh/MocA family oxidoreductase n=1 Tax=Nocardioides marmotae TaxID=2663857 RepID=A0A6I3JCW0_9ACTN|nr:Gfo/Idh/MocA family oxidoreductase [Nocardioides marmotae]MCR6032277.1 gfo/Idh/MocA family oxidoreductase [Gordonia jinghuaiqii]MTB95925.1 gfo/Idh/MocA family oxidoreductase [Nocardioides marmotae]QKE02735.1 Gfo/Idh/MocA family oxidoreductase [Nocardioides marmotae]
MTEPAAAPTRWGILATGKIARTFARDLALVPDAELVAVGSRRAEAAAAFAAEHGGRPHGSYEELVADPDVEVVYVASPHALHLEHARLAFEAGKHVLCEKPLTLSTADAEEMVRLAGKHDRFLMEAMWTACHPLVRTVAEQVRAGRYGTPRHLHAELGFRVDAGPDDRMLDPALGASALLDMGIYPLTFAHLVLGEAEQLTGTADLSDRGIDLDVAISGRYPGGALATMTASITSWSSRAAAIATDLGRIDVPDFHHPTRATFTPYDGGDGDAAREPVEILAEDAVIGRGYGNEIAEVGRCLRAGLRESPWVPHTQTLTLMRQMDAVRAQVGVSFG